MPGAGEGLRQWDYGVTGAAGRRQGTRRPGGSAIDPGEHVGSALADPPGGGLCSPAVLPEVWPIPAPRRGDPLRHRKPADGRRQPGDTHGVSPAAPRPELGPGERLCSAAECREAWSANADGPCPLPMTPAILIFVVALGLIASERVDRTKVALLGAVLMLLTQTIDQETAIEAIDWNTLGLLVGMMIVVRVTEPTGAYTWVAIRAGQLSRGPPVRGGGGAGADDRGAVGVPGQPHDGPADGADHVPARGRARRRPDPAGDHRDPRLEHRRHGDADRRPAEHHDRGRDRALVRRVHREPRAGGGGDADRGHRPACTSSTARSCRSPPRRASA